MLYQDCPKRKDFSRLNPRGKNPTENLALDSKGSFVENFNRDKVSR
jgi:hypothetical protein